MKQHFENLEDSLLTPYAVKSKTSKGRTHKEKPSQTRTCFQRDRDRIIYSKAFRRLKDKTQVFTPILSDHFRSRLTHTIEVSQISRHLARLLHLNEDLTECIALAHDLGHSPFGHSGEEALNTLLLDEGGFEHNLHSLKIVEELEQKYPDFRGLNLSFEVKEGLKKHQTPWDNPTINSQFVSLEAQIANIADEVAYNNHDIDDGLTSTLLDINDLIKNIQLIKEAHSQIAKEYTNLEKHETKHLVNSSIISQQVLNIYNSSKKTIQKYNIKTLNDVQELNKSVISFDKEMTEKNNELRHYLYKNLYRHKKIKESNQLGQTIINNMFHFLKQNSQLLPNSFLKLIQKNDYSFNKTIGFYIAGMTDTFAVHFCNIHNLHNSKTPPHTIL
ncbi:deoxyguanosinetriphosphate triphosphohydrolase [Candidatus Marinamargulisbacteria bacterium SCGC AG-343-D04]|nr:deoxyguanosinetriphosphate triphosphohydrolase [Candidatus Marinamargulisbacteria bacterium SCGC AG-343-D04]